ncbi:MAG: SDR family oxidoreductase [Planctomycetota bacterium]|nr:MAG: SDR family oxidoreductase [Planctomycetota bacterium]
MARYLITGGGGFIGSHLVYALVERGERVRVVDDFSTGRRENLVDIWDRIELMEGDICEEELAREACEGVEIIFHQAAIPSVPRSLERPMETHRVNALGTLNLLEQARRLGVRRFIYASSSSVYGDDPVLPKVESLTPLPLSPYAVQKLTGEYYCRLYHRIYSLETVCLRYFNVFGPRQRPDSPYAAVIPRFIQRMMDREAPMIYGDGEQTRDFTYVENVVEANLKAAEAPSGAMGRVYNVATGRRVSLNELVSYLNRMMGTDIRPKYCPARLGDVEHSLADLSLIREWIGYQPKVFWKEGLQKTLDWMQKTVFEKDGR